MVRVFMLSMHPLFGQGVESLLRRETGMEIVGQETEVDKAIEHIAELRPDAVIVDSTDPACDPTATVTRILRAGVTARIIGLNLGDNTLSLYRGEQRVAKGVEDLIKAVNANGSHTLEFRMN